MTRKKLAAELASERAMIGGVRRYKLAAELHFFLRPSGHDAIKNLFPQDALSFPAERFSALLWSPARRGPKATLLL